MDGAFNPAASNPPSIRWSLSAGLYMFVCGTATALALSDVLGLLASVIGLPPAVSLGILASPAFVVGTASWWAVVERREAYTYLLAAVSGLVTALATGIVWTLRFVSVWGFEMLAAEMVTLLIGAVLGVISVAGALAGLPLMYVRRRGLG